MYGEYNSIHRCSRLHPIGFTDFVESISQTVRIVVLKCIIGGNSDQINLSFNVHGMSVVVTQEIELLQEWDPVENTENTVTGIGKISGSTAFTFSLYPVIHTSPFLLIMFCAHNQNCSSCYQYSNSDKHPAHPAAVCPNEK